MLGCTHYSPQRHGSYPWTAFALVVRGVIVVEQRLACRSGGVQHIRVHVWVAAAAGNRQLHLATRS